MSVKEKEVVLLGGREREKEKVSRRVERHKLIALLLCSTCYLVVVALCSYPTYVLNTEQMSNSEYTAENKGVREVII